MQKNNRRYQVEIISASKNNRAWFNSLVGQTIKVRFVRYYSHDFLLYGLTEDFKYIRADHLKILNDPYVKTIEVENHNEPTCTHFGCSANLSSYGQLFNNRCPDHQVKQKIDVMKVLKFK